MALQLENQAVLSSGLLAGLVGRKICHFFTKLNSCLAKLSFITIITILTKSLIVAASAQITVSKVLSNNCMINEKLIHYIHKK